MIEHDNILISGNFDGGNPKSYSNIIKNGANSYTILPFSEDNDPNYKFRLDLKICNKCSSSKKIDITIDWQVDKYNYLRNYIYKKNGLDIEWKYIPFQFRETQTTGQLTVEPGTTYICLHPKYNYKDYLDFLNNVKESALITKEFIGITKGQKEL